jgi:hypothetical protein
MLSSLSIHIFGGHSEHILITLYKYHIIGVIERNIPPRQVLATDALVDVAIILLRMNILFYHTEWNVMVILLYQTIQRSR